MARGRGRRLLAGQSDTRALPADGRVFKLISAGVPWKWPDQAGDAPSLLAAVEWLPPDHSSSALSAGYPRRFSPDLLEGAKAQGVVIPGRHPLNCRFSPAAVLAISGRLSPASPRGTSTSSPAAAVAAVGHALSRPWDGWAGAWPPSAIRLSGHSIAVDGWLVNQRGVKLAGESAVRPPPGSWPVGRRVI